MAPDTRIGPRDATPRILVVEDDSLIAMMIQDMLADFGHEVVGPFGQLAKAVEAARRERLDAAILDVNLDGAPVYPVAEALAARGIPFLFATGYGNGGLREPWSGRPTLAKPFYRGDLERTLARLLSSKAH